MTCRGRDGTGGTVCWITAVSSMGASEIVQRGTVLRPLLRRRRADKEEAKLCKRRGEERNENEVRREDGEWVGWRSGGEHEGGKGRSVEGEEGKRDGGQRGMVIAAKSCDFSAEDESELLFVCLFSSLYRVVGERNGTASLISKINWIIKIWKKKKIVSRFTDVVTQLHRTVTPTWYVITVISESYFATFVSVSGLPWRFIYSAAIVAWFAFSTRTRGTEEPKAPPVLISSDPPVSSVQRLPWSPGDSDPIFSCDLRRFRWRGARSASSALTSGLIFLFSGRRSDWDCTHVDLLSSKLRLVSVSIFSLFPVAIQRDACFRFRSVAFCCWIFDPPIVIVVILGLLILRFAHGSCGNDGAHFREAI